MPNSVIALFGISGRSDTTYAALLLAHSLTSVNGTAVALVRVRMPHDPALPPAPDRSPLVEVVEREIVAEQEASFFAHEQIADALQRGRNVVLDLPLPSIRDEVLRSRLDVPLLVVGPTPLEEHAASAALAGGDLETPIERAIRAGWTSSNGGAPARVRLLGCGRSGGAPAASAFNRTIEKGSCGMPVHGLPFALPVPARREASALFEGRPLPASLEVGRILAEVLVLCAAHSGATADQLSTIAAANGVGPTLARDRRAMSERLLELGHELQAIRDGVKPTAEDLAQAPTLEGWSFETEPLPVVSGRAFGHPDFPSGRRVRTSDLFALDPEGRWVRTLSRYWKLGISAGGVDTRPN